jgi:hypothetical protein
MTEKATAQRIQNAQICARATALHARRGENLTWDQWSASYLNDNWSLVR